MRNFERQVFSFWPSGRVPAQRLLTLARNAFLLGTQYFGVGLGGVRSPGDSRALHHWRRSLRERVEWAGQTSHSSGLQ